MSKQPINLAPFFDAIADFDYMIIRGNQSFPELEKGKDIDIVADEPEKVSRLLLKVAHQDLPKKYEAKLHATNEYIHIDILLQNELLLRFDVVDALDGKYVELKPEFIPASLKRARTKSSKKLNYKVADDLDDLVFRWAEYVDKYPKTPRKKKHKSFIDEYVQNNGDELFKKRRSEAIKITLNYLYKQLILKVRS